MSLVQLQSTISNALTTGQYNINTVVNSSLYGIPFITVGLIGITSMVLAYVTIIENNNDNEESSDFSSPASNTTTSFMPKLPDLGIPQVFSSSTPSEQPQTNVIRGGKTKKRKGKSNSTRKK
jgi:hypothetical protein